MLYYVTNLLKPDGFFMYTRFSIQNSTWCLHSVFTCFLRISEETATFAVNNINKLSFYTKVESVYCVVRTESLYKTDTFNL